MLTFKQYLSEKEGVKWSTTVRKLITDKGEMEYLLPFSNSIIKRIFKPVIATSYHVTNLKNFKRLVALQGKKSSVSSTTKIDASFVKHGVQGGGGIVSKIKGTLILSGLDDLMTVPDSGGARWVSMYTIEDIPGNWKQKIDKIRKNVLEAAGEKFDLTFRGWKSWDKQIDKLENAGKIRHFFIKTYIDGLEKLMLDNPEVMNKSMRNPLKGGETVGEYATWNELVISDFKIIEVFIADSEWRDNYIEAGFLKQFKTILPIADSGPKYMKAFNKFKKI